MTQEFVTMPRTVVEQIISAFDTDLVISSGWQKKTAAALRAALEQSNRQSVHESELMMNDASYRRKFEQPQVEQEPVAWLHADGKHQPLYTHPQPKREPLTDEQIDAIADAMPGGLKGFMKGWGWRQFARAVLEATHNIK